MKGIVYKSTGSWYDVKTAEGEVWKARIKGKFRIDDEISSTNPIAVGDRVTCMEEDAEKRIAMIEKIDTRKNYIVRVSPHNKNQKHIIASNLDQAMLIATVNNPRTSNGFIDRFLVTAEAYHVPAILVFNKIDAVKPKDQAILDHLYELYTGIGYKVLKISAIDATTLDELKSILHNKTTLISGHSGVGKSTLINQLIPGMELKTNEISNWSGKGQHTTTFAEMMDMDEQSVLIDTPGMKEFGLIDFEKQELSHFFPEMKERLKNCKFNNCIHMHEPGCAVAEAVVNGAITEERFHSYLNIMESIEEKYK